MMADSRNTTTPDKDDIVDEKSPLVAVSTGQEAPSTMDSISETPSIVMNEPTVTLETEGNSICHNIMNMDNFQSKAISGTSQDPSELAPKRNPNQDRRKSAILPITSKDGEEHFVELADEGAKRFIKFRDGNKIVIYEKIESLPDDDKIESLATVVLCTGEAENNVAPIAIGGTRIIEQPPTEVSTEGDVNCDTMDKEKLTTEKMLKIDKLTDAVELLLLQEKLNTPENKTKWQKMINYSKRVGLFVRIGFYISQLVELIVACIP